VWIGVGGKIYVMSEHMIMLIVMAVGFAIQITGLVMMIAMLRDAHRMTRAVAGLVCQESDEIRALLGR